MIFSIFNVSLQIVFDIRQIQISMINRAKPQNFGIQKLGSSPLRKMDHFQHVQKENYPYDNAHHRLPQPLISPKHQQPEEALMFDHLPRQKTNFHKPARSPRPLLNTKNVLMCCNHPGKKAQFRVQTQDGQEHFCQRCAAQLVTQGCTVEQLEVSTEKGMKMSKKNSLPHLPQFQQEPIYHQIMDILKLCNTVVSEQTSNIQKFSNLEEEYNRQVDLTTAFYDRLIEIIDEMKTDHLNDLVQEKDKYTQIADIENDNSRENIVEVNIIKRDIQDNMEEVLSGIQNSGDSSECSSSLDHYRHKLTLYRHQTEEQLDSINQVTRYSQRQIDTMLHNFQNFLRSMWEDAQSPQNHELVQQMPPQKNISSALTVKNIHQILPRGVIYDGNSNKRAFRNLEAEQDEENIDERKSPNFKRI